MEGLFQRITNPHNIKKFLVFNIAILFAIKVALPLSGPQLATVLEQLVPFNSREIITKTNEVRAANNLTPLNPNAKLDMAASQKLNDMAAKNYFAHISPDGISPWFWIEQSGYNYFYAGENLALGFSGPEETVHAWMNSSTHKANIMNINYAEIGVATGKATINGRSGILVVQMFGKSAAQSPVSQSVPAKISPTPLPYIATQTVAKDKIAGSKTEPTKLQYVSTDKNLPPVLSPSESPTRLKSPIELNKLYQIYLISILVVLAFVIIFGGLNRRVVFATTINIFLLLSSALVPAISITTQGLVF